jgi:lysophospholipase L1-like esterase
MRVLLFAALSAGLLWPLGGPALAQSRPVLPNSAPGTGAAPDALLPVPGNLRIEWEVKNRFRLFRNDADFRRHAAAMRGDGVLAAEQRLARASDGRGWARDMVGNLCIDQSGRIPETCQRDGERENFMAPVDHRIGVGIVGAIAPGALCAWTFDDRESAPKQVTAPCADELKLRVRYGVTTLAIVDVGLPDGTAQRLTADIAVRDFLIAGMGDSIAAGEGNPDQPIVLDDEGFCFRRFLASSTSEYFRPGRAGFKGSKACDSTPTPLTDWQRLNARWMNAACHRSLYGYQMRAALALAVEQTHAAVTFLPIACSGSTIELGFLSPLRTRECPPSGPCASTTVPQITQLKEAMAIAGKQSKDRKLDLILLTIGANDIWFAGLVGDVIIQPSTERTLFEKGGMIIDVPEAQKILDTDLPGDFAKVRAALKPFVGGNLSRVVYVTYGNPTLAGPNNVCPASRAGFDVHPAFSVDATRLKRVSDFVENKFLPRMQALASCDAPGACRDPVSERMIFVDQHQADFANHGFCAHAEDDPVFDRECFSAKGESFETDLATAAVGPLVCNLRPRDFRPYAPRARWIRTANDSYFTAMTFPEGISPVLKPSDLHDATWGATSAVYGGAIHPTAEGHAAMADAALPSIRAALDLQAPPAIRAEPLPPPMQQTR